MEIDNEKTRMILVPILNSARILGIASSENGVLSLDLYKLEKLSLTEVKENFALNVNAIFAGRGSTTPGFSNIGLDFEGNERLQSTYKFNINENIPTTKNLFNKKYKDKMTSAHTGQERTPAPVKKYFESGKADNAYEVKKRLNYLFSMMSDKNEEEAFKSAGMFEYERQTRARVMCCKGKDFTQENKLDKIISKCRKEFEKMCTKKQEKEYKNFPTSAVKGFLPFLILNQQDEFKVTKIFSDEKISIFDFIRETDGWTRREYKKRFNKEFPFLTDRMVDDILIFSKDFLSQKDIDALKIAIL